MKKITFEVKSKESCSVTSLIKAVNKISCRISFDFDKGLVVAQNVDDELIDSVIELVNEHYTISSVDIDNTIETLAEDLKKNVSSETVQESIKKTTKEVVEKNPTVLGPQSEDDLIIKKVEFQNPVIEETVNKFLRSAYWAMFHKNVQEKDIQKYIYTCINEMSMEYSQEKPIEFAVGDIVDCNYGQHIKGEINGGHIGAIICNILNDNMAYVVPVVKVREDITSHACLLLDLPQDAIYYDEYYNTDNDGIVLVNKGKYVRVERFRSVVGKTKPEFFAKLLNQIATAFDFTSNLKEITGDVVNEKQADETVEEVIVVQTEGKETIEEADNSVDEVSETKYSHKKIGGEEKALLEAIGNSLNNLDKSKSALEQIEKFMLEINMNTTGKLVFEAFAVACDIKKINYENVILELHNMNPNIKEDIIKASLKEDFKSWLENYPEVAEKCPKISIISLLKVFAKRFV